MSNLLQSIIEEVERTGHGLKIFSEIKKGKEAILYKGFFDQKVVAIKVYIDPEQRAFKETGEYLEGKYYQRSSHKKAIAKGGKFGKKKRHENWIKREFYTISELYKRGADVPQPLLQIENGMIMEYFGDSVESAPRLIDVDLSEKEANIFFEIILKNIKLFWNAGIVHGDLSPYNILWWNNKPIIIDFPQSIDIRTHPNPLKILERDLANIIKHFRKYVALLNKSLC